MEPNATSSPSEPLVTQSPTEPPATEVEIEAEESITSSPTNENDVYLIENVACVAFEGNILHHADHQSSDETCKTNTCPNGCCRSYWWLLCDEDNSYTFAPCVCNENTQDPDNFVSNKPPISATQSPESLDSSNPDACKDGSIYQRLSNFDHLTPCSDGQGCGEGECCVTKYCLCMNPESVDECLVPVPEGVVLDADL
jgi:hypothetical protein